MLFNFADSKIKQEKVEKEEENIKEDDGEAKVEIETEKKSSYRPFDIANLTRPDKPGKKSRDDPLEVWKRQLHPSYREESEPGKHRTLLF